MLNDVPSTPDELRPRTALAFMFAAWITVLATAWAALGSLDFEQAPDDDSIPTNRVAVAGLDR